MTELQSRFGKYIAAYVRLRRCLGLKFVKQEIVLREFDLYAHRRGCRGHLTANLLEGFVVEQPDATGETKARRHQIVAAFADYLAIHEPTTAAIRRVPWKVDVAGPAYILSDREVDRLASCASWLTPKIQALTVQTMIGLSASCGLRPAEVTNLERVDVDLSRGTLLIRETKFQKTRLLPVHPTTLDALRALAFARDDEYTDSIDTSFFLSRRRRRFAPAYYSDLFAESVGRAGIRDESGKRPRLYDLRHTFAVRRLRRWYETGADVQAKLAALATYMGHRGYEQTAYYLHAAPELLQVAARRFLDAVQGASDAADA